MNAHSPGPRIVTFGCRLNAAESEAIRGHAIAAGLSDAVIVNTCAVTAEAERQARQMIRKLRRENGAARIIVTGCAAQVDPARFAAMPEVDRVVGNAEKLRPATWAEAEPARVAVADIMAVRETAPHLTQGFEGRARAFLEIQQGCDHRCTFCIIPFGRGPSRSVPLGEVAARARRLVDAGLPEIVLTGVDLTSYGDDLPGQPGLGQVVRRLLATVPELKRLRLSSLDPVEIDDELIALYGAEPRLMPHLHLSLQAGDDLVLKRMKRRHVAADAMRVIERVRMARPDVAIGADLIAGFPTETDAMFANTLSFVRNANLVWLHVFPYSARPGTPAARMPQVPVKVRRERAALLREAGERQLEAWLDSRVGAEAAVLVEDGVRARDDYYAPVTLDRALDAGMIARVSVEARDGGALEGRVLA